MSGSDVRLTEADVKAVLERAVKIEARNETLTVPQLTSVAREAGISEEALIQAVTELLEQRQLATVNASVLQSPPAPQEEAAGWKRNLRRWARISAWGAAGLFAGALVGGGLGPLALGGLFIGCGFNVFDKAPGRSLRDYLLETTAAWAWFALGTGLLREGLLIQATYPVAFIAWLLTAGIGGVIVAKRNSTPTHPAPAKPIS